MLALSLTISHACLCSLAVVERTMLQQRLSRTGITGYFGYPAVSGVSFVDMVATSLMVLNANMLAKVNSEI